MKPIEFETTARPLHPIAGGEQLMVILPDGFAQLGAKLRIIAMPAEPPLKPCPWRGGELTRYDPLHPLTCLELHPDTVCHCGNGRATYRSDGQVGSMGWTGWYAPGHGEPRAERSE